LSSGLYSNIHCCSAIVCTHKSIYYWETCLCLKELISEELQPISTEYCKFYPTCNVKNNYYVFTFFYPIYESLQRIILAYKYEIPYISILNNVFLRNIFTLWSVVLILWKGFTYVHYTNRYRLYYLSSVMQDFKQKIPYLYVWTRFYKIGRFL